MTLYGEIDVVDVEASPQWEKYRQIHMKNNPKYKQFMQGDNIAVLVVTISSARICDFQDRVRVWHSATAQLQQAEK